jgi:glycosyltransferase involved in cell wall biosynthesis
MISGTPDRPRGKSGADTTTLDSPITLVPVITVCLPTFNRALLLRDCLESIISQTLRDIEILVGDNCSPDDTAAVVAGFNDPRITYIRRPQNIGAVPNINDLLTRARGRYVVIAHDDDVYQPEFLAREAALLDECPGVGMVHCSAVATGIDGSLQGLIRAYPTTCVRPSRAEFERYLEGHNVVCSTAMVRRSVYDDVGLWEPKHECADFHLWLRIALRSDVGYVAEPLVHVRVHEDSWTSVVSAQRWYNEFTDIVRECLALAAASGWDLSNKFEILRLRGARAQGKRFFIAAVSATAKGRFSEAREYRAVLEQLQRDGMPYAYVAAARWLNNRPGQALLRGVRGVWRASAVLKRRWA